MRYRRLLDRYGCVQFQHWKIYGEEGLAGKEAAVWLYKEVLTVTFSEQPLAHYSVVYEAMSSSRIQELRDPHVSATPLGSAQLRLWDSEPVAWYPVRYRPPPATPPTSRYHRRGHTTAALASRRSQLLTALNCRLQLPCCRD